MGPHACARRRNRFTLMPVSFDWLLRVPYWHAPGNGTAHCEFALSDFLERSGLTHTPGSWQVQLHTWNRERRAQHCTTYEAQLEVRHGIVFVQVTRCCPSDTDR